MNAIVDPTSFRQHTLQDGLRALQTGGMVVMVDSPDRENEGDLIMAAEFATPAAVNFMTRWGRGLICAPMEAEALARLEIPPMTTRNTDPKGTAFHVSVDHLLTNSTGISASDRAATLRALARPASRPADFSQPGHIFPLAARAGGVLERPGHTEASVELLKMAGLTPVAVICEILREDGEMMRVPELLPFARLHGFPFLTIEALVENRAAARRRSMAEAGIAAA